MKKVITYGTYDLFHEGHYKLLKRAKELGDYLIVGVTTENYDNSRGKLNINECLMKRIERIQNSGLADEIILEEYEGQKIDDIQKFKVDIFAIGSDWTGKFDYLKEYCNVVYLERTKNISSTLLRAQSNGVIKLGLVGCGITADIFISESKFVSGVNVEGVFGCNPEELMQFTKKNELAFFSLDAEEFFDRINAVYISSQWNNQNEYIKMALRKGVHVLCDKPMVLSVQEADEIYALARYRKCILLEAIETAYCPGFLRLISSARSGLIGKIMNVDATITKLSADDKLYSAAGTTVGGVSDFAPYPLLLIIKLLGHNFEEVSYYTFYDSEREKDLFTKIILRYKDAIATANVGIGVKCKGDLIISGTKGYIYVPSPWWKTEYFEIHLENSADNKRHFYKFQGEGLRYELAEFISMINKKEAVTYKLTQNDTTEIARIIERFRNKENVYSI